MRLRKIELLDKDIDEVISDLARISTQIIEIKREIDSNKKIIEVLRGRVEQNRKVLLEYFVYLYKK